MGGQSVGAAIELADNEFDDILFYRGKAARRYHLIKF
jgi:hypothetical protein